MKPLNDLAKIKIKADEYGFGGDQKTTAETGILVELPEELHYFGFWSFAFEHSFMEAAKLSKLLKYWNSKIGKRVYWTALSERGNILKMNDEMFCFVKLTSLIAASEPDQIATNVHSDGMGSFGLEQ